MKRIVQRPNGCFAACLAMVTGIPLDLVPHATKKELQQYQWYKYNNRIVRWLHKHGWFKLWLGDKFAPKGFAIVHGTSPRGIGHCCIVKDGKLLHDPFPTGGGVTDIEGYEIVVRLVKKGKRS